MIEDVIYLLSAILFGPGVNEELSEISLIV